MQVLLLLLSIRSDPKPTDFCCWCKPGLGWNVQKWRVGDSLQPLSSFNDAHFVVGLSAVAFSHGAPISQRTHWFEFARFLCTFAFPSNTAWGC